jgi:hypothetical protein
VFDVLTTPPHTLRTVHLATILHWQHRRGGDAHCLARLLIGPAGRQTAVLSEIRSNRDGRDVGDDFTAAAGALLAMPLADLAGVDPATVVWIVHYGGFSYHDSEEAPETYTRVPLVWDGERYHDNLDGHRQLDGVEVTDLVGGMALTPVPQVLADLGWRY